MSIVSLRTLSRESILRKSLNIFTEVVTQPSFKQKYLTRAKRQILQSIRAAQQSPSSIASIAFNKAVFGEHPYAHEAIGTQDTIGNITTKDLKHHYQQFFAYLLTNSH
jgi:zinc protease